METQFKYLEEDTKFWIISLAVSLAILVLVFLSGKETGNISSAGIDGTGQIGNYSRILGLNPFGDHRSWKVIESDLLAEDKWQRGEMAYTADIR